MAAIKCKKTGTTIAESSNGGECMCKSVADCLYDPAPTEEEAKVEKELIVCVAPVAIREGIPEAQPDKCPACGGTDFDQGYGMAGGGMGVYSYCIACGKVTSKVQTE